MITVSGNLFEITGSAAPSASSFVRFWMRGTGGNQPFVSGTALLAPNGGNTWYTDLAPNGSGAVSGSLFSTSDVTVGGVTGAIYYGMQIYQNGFAGPESPVSASQNININSPNILTSLPVVTAPTGDSTYLRLDGTNYASKAIANLATVAYSATPTFNASNANVFQITLTGNVTSSTLSGATAGQIMVFKVIQDGVGGRSFTWPTNVLNATPPETTASAITVQAFFYDGTNAYPVGPATVN